jgi:hypothetical protein
MKMMKGMSGTGEHQNIGIFFNKNSQIITKVCFNAFEYNGKYFFSNFFQTCDTDETLKYTYVLSKLVSKHILRLLKRANNRSYQN